MITRKTVSSLEVIRRNFWEKSYDKSRQHFKKQRHHFANKGPYNQSFVDLLLAMLGLCCCAGFPLVATSRGYFLVAVYTLLTEVVSLASEQGL